MQDYYLLISWPVIAVGLASFFVSGCNLSRRLFSMAGWIFVTAGFTGLLAAVFLIWHPRGADKLVDTVTHGRTVWEGIGDISSERLSGFIPLILIASCSSALAGGVIIYFAHQSRFLAIVGSCAALMIVLFLASNRGLQLVEDEFSSARVASALQQIGGADYQVVCEFEANDLTSLFFYLPHSILWLNANPDLEFATRNLGIGRDLYLNEERFQALWRSNERIFLIASQTRLPHSANLPQLDGRPGQPCTTSPPHLISINRPLPR